MIIRIILLLIMLFFVKLVKAEDLGGNYRGYQFNAVEQTIDTTI